MNSVNAFKSIVCGFGMLIVMLLASQILGMYWYQSSVFVAKVDSISYYHTGSLFSSASKAIVKFDNGVVADVWEAPKVLREGEVYKVDYRTPYFMKDLYLVIKEYQQ